MREFAHGVLFEALSREAVRDAAAAVALDEVLRALVAGLTRRGVLEERREDALESGDVPCFVPGARVIAVLEEDPGLRQLLLSGYETRSLCAMSSLVARGGRRVARRRHRGGRGATAAARRHPRRRGGGRGG